LKGRPLVNRAIELSQTPLHKKVILFHYYRTEILNNGQQIQKIDLDAYFTALLEAVGLSPMFAAIPETPLEEEALEERANALSASPRQEKAILCGYYTIETLEDGQRIKQANLKDFFNALIEATFTPEQVEQLREEEKRLLQEEDEFKEDE
jgi:hypothetical protein